MDLSKISKSTLVNCANTIRILSAEAVEKANSGHPGMPMGMAEVGACLWLRHLKINPKFPKWINRDRFVLSNGHGSMFLYSLLHLSGFNLSIEDLKNFRQWGSKTPGHPESFMTEGVEATTGPLGQGISNAVGMAIAERNLNSRFSKNGIPIDHKTFVIAGDGCLMEGVSSEACSIAGHLGLSNLIVIYDDNKISIAGHTKLAFSEDVLKRYEAYGWQVLTCDGHDVLAVDQAISQAISETTKPSIIAARTLIGKGSPNKNNTHGVHGSPLGKEELTKTKEALGWKIDQDFYVPEDVRETFQKRQKEWEDLYLNWEENYKQWRDDSNNKALEFDSVIEVKVPKDLAERLYAGNPASGKPVSTRKISAQVLQTLAKEVPSLIGGSADLEPSTLTVIEGSDAIQKNSYSGRNIHFGVREHAMGSIMNGFSYYGAFIPFGSTFLCFLDYMRPPIRVASLSHLRGLFVFTHDSIFLGEDGPTHQPVEHLATLRAIPNLWTFRPANEIETSTAYALAAERRDGPSVLVFTRQNLAPIAYSKNVTVDDVKKGAYIAYESNPKPEVVLIATGSEVSITVEVAKSLDKDFSIRVVSMPCCEIFLKQKKEYRDYLLPESSAKMVIEAASSFGWKNIIGSDVKCHTIDTFGASAPQEVLAEKYNFTFEAIAQAVLSLRLNA